MGFWIFMLIFLLLIPALMIIFGAFFLKKAPKEINFAFGYRTARSMKNMKTWQFAHKYIGRLWLIIGIALLPVAVIPLLFLTGASEDLIGNVGIAICFVEMAAMILPIIPTELALKKHFDKDGNEKTREKGEKV